MTARLLVAVALTVATNNANVVLGPSEPDTVSRVLVVEVKDLMTGLPLSGALVRVQRDKAFATTDSGGTARFPGKVRMTQAVLVTLLGYKVAETDRWPVGRDSSWASVQLAAGRARPVTGVVTDGSDSTPLAGAAVTLGRRTVRADSLGRFLFRAARGRLQNMTAACPGYVSCLRRISLGSGDTVNIRLSLFDSSAKGGLTGLVTDRRTGEALSGASVFLPTTELGAASGASGLYTIKDIPPGDYDIECSYMGYVDQKRHVVVTPGRATRLDFELSLW